MQETGRIIEINGEMAKVEVAQREICHRCPSENFCRLATGDSRQIEAVNKIGAKPGDIVKIEIGSGRILTGAFIVYILPIVALLAGGVLTEWFGGSQNMAIITGMIALGVSFLIIWILNKWIARSRKMIPVIKEIIEG